MENNEEQIESAPEDPTEEEGFLDESDLNPESGSPAVPIGSPADLSPGDLGTQSYFEVRWREADGGSSSTRHGNNIDDARQFTRNRRSQGLQAVLVIVSVLEIPV